ncbi:MAG TPA: shikimate kinase [Phycisphaerales bacterium]|nr:shikimate kinase [Phycisphaerales bacterium]HMP35929.1 shikimate kinase [Phycisphaerales bacterium]
MERSSTPPSIVLIGPRAVGKSAVGAVVAARLGRPFVDLDRTLRARFGGATVAEIWATHGEARWREAEAAGVTAVLDDAERSGPVVFALGGGAPMVEGVRRRLQVARERREAIIVLLLAPVALLARRMRRNPESRPSLTGGDPIDEIEGVLARRLPIYRALAEREVMAERGSRHAVAQAVLRAIEARPGAG